MNIKKANKWSSILVLSVTTLLILFVLILGSGEPYTGSQAQGGAILFIGAVSIIALVILGFPLAIKLITRWGVCSYLSFSVAVLTLTLVFSLFSTIALGAIGFGFELESMIRLTVILFVLLVTACVPLSIFWWLVAQKTHNPSFKSDA